MTEPDRPRPFRVPWNVDWRGREHPDPGRDRRASLTGLAFLSVLAFHDTARWVGLGWMAFGLLFYVVYRKVVEGTSLTRRVSVSERALTKQVPEISYRNILVPVFGTELDDDIVSTAGRLAAATAEEADGRGDERPARGRLRGRGAADAAARRRAAARARGGGRGARSSGPARSARSTRTSRSRPSCVRARDVGAGIVEEARRSRAEAIVVGGEPPTKVRGGAVLGGIGGRRPAEIGSATQYVLKKAPCRVLLTAPPEVPAEPGSRPSRASAD